MWGTSVRPKPAAFSFLYTLLPIGTHRSAAQAVFVTSGKPEKLHHGATLSLSASITPEFNSVSCVAPLTGRQMVKSDKS